MLYTFYLTGKGELDISDGQALLILPLLPLEGTRAVRSAGQASAARSVKREEREQAPQSQPGPEQCASGREQACGCGEQTSVSCVPKPCSAYLALIVPQIYGSVTLPFPHKHCTLTVNQPLGLLREHQGALLF